MLIPNGLGMVTEINATSLLLPYVLYLFLVVTTVILVVWIIDGEAMTKIKTRFRNKDFVAGFVCGYIIVFLLVTIKKLVEIFIL